MRTASQGHRGCRYTLTFSVFELNLGGCSSFSPRSGCFYQIQDSITHSLGAHGTHGVSEIPWEPRKGGLRAHRRLPCPGNTQHFGQREGPAKRGLVPAPGQPRICRKGLFPGTRDEQNCQQPVSTTLRLTLNLGQVEVHYQGEGRSHQRGGVSSTKSQYQQLSRCLANMAPALPRYVPRSPHLSAEASAETQTEPPVSGNQVPL